MKHKMEAMLWVALLMLAGATGDMLQLSRDDLFFLRTQGSVSATLEDLLTKFSSNISQRMVYSGSGFVNTEFAKPNMPTLLRLFQNNVMEYFTGATITSFIEDGLLRRLDSLYERESWHSKIPKSLADTCKHPTLPGYYCVPYNTYTWAMYFRPSVFARLGIQQPTTWGELQVAFQKFKAAGIKPMAYPAKAEWYSGAWIDYLNMRINGVNFHRNLTQGGVPYSDPRVRNVLDFWGDLFTSGDMEVVDGDWTAVRDMLVDGEVGVFLIGDFIHWGYDPLRSDIDFFRFPVIDPSLPLGEDAPTDSYIIPNGTTPNGPVTPESVGLTAERLLGELLDTKFMQSNLNMYAIPANTLAITGDISPLVQKAAKMLEESDTVFQFFDRDCPREFALRAVKKLTEFVTGTPADTVLEHLDADRLDVYFGKVTPPVIIPGGGTFVHTTSFTMESFTKDAQVFYTTDGSTPTIYSLLYNSSRGPITLGPGSWVVRAFAFKQGLDPSPMTEVMFVVTEPASDNIFVIVLPLIGGVLLIVLLAGLWKGTANYRKMRSLLSAVALAESTAESVAEMDFENVRFLYELENPSRLQKAFIKIIHNLELYKSFLPAALLERLQREEGQVACVPPPGIESHCATVVFTDIRKSTTLWEAVPEAMKRAMRVHNNVVRDSIAEFRGYEVKTIGDAFMVAFESPQDGVRFGLAVQQRLVEATWPPELSEVPMCARQFKGSSSELLWYGLSIRVGVNSGPVSVEEDSLTGRADYFGHTVNVAARLENKAVVGSVAIPDEVWKNVTLSDTEVFASSPELVTLAGAKDPVSMVTLWPKALAGRQNQALNTTTAVILRGDSFSSQRTDMTRVTKVAKGVLSNYANSDRGEVVTCTVATAQVAMDPISVYTGSQLSEGVMTVLQAVDRSQGMLLGVVGDRTCAGWNLGHRNQAHIECALQFGRMLHGALPVFGVGLVCGNVWHGSIGNSQQRFVTAAGMPITGSHELCTVAAQGKKCLFAAADACIRLPNAVRRQLCETTLCATTVEGVVHELNPEAGEGYYNTSPDKDAFS